MTPELLVALLAALLVLGAGGLAYLAHTGRVSWGWAVGALGTALALLGLRARVRRDPEPAPAPAPPVQHRAVVAPVVDEGDAQAGAQLDAIGAANDDEDRLARLRRLAEVNNGGRAP